MKSSSDIACGGSHEVPARARSLFVVTNALRAREVCPAGHARLRSGLGGFDVLPEDDSEGRLDALVARHAAFTTGPTSEAVLDEIDVRLGRRMPSQLRAFALRYGGGYFGSVHVYPADPGEDRSVSIEELTAQITTWSSELRRFWVFALDGAGNPLLVGDDNAVFLFDHDARSLEKLADSFRAFICNALEGALSRVPR